MPHPIFTVSVQEIQLLNDEQARELVARLSQAEAEKLGASKPTVTWGGDQRAKDGGIDVRFDAVALAAPSAYLPTPRVGFQVKAEKFPPSKIPGEMIPKGVLSESIKDLVETANAYIIVSTRDSVSDTSLTLRKNAMAESVTIAGASNTGVLDFFDARRVADWVEGYPAIVTWVKQAVNRSQTGWRPYGPWAYRESDENAEYLLDDKVKVYSPDRDEGNEVLEAINALRTDIASGKTVRLVGLSGVGKTRLVQALFDERISTAAPALSKDAVIYADLSDELDPQPTTMIEALVDSGFSTYVVVDNCGQDLHKRLSEIVARASSTIGLVTVEYDIRDDLPEGTSCYRLEGASDNVIKELLGRRYTHLSANDVDRVTEFSDGNARVAFALANASERKDELAQLTDDDLFRRLFHQKQVENDELLRCAEIASLLYSFDGENLDKSGELGLLASLAEVSSISLYRNVAELMRRGLVQQRGQWRAVLPHAIANKLAARALENFPSSYLATKLIEGPSERVARSFSRRLGYLHNSPVAKSIVGRLLKAGGRLDRVEDFDDLDRQIFGNLAPVDPPSVLKVLMRAITRPIVISLDDIVVSDLVKVARALAYDAELFDGALEVLLAFAMGGVEKASRNSCQEAITTLFTCHLSGTIAPPEQRVTAVVKLLSATERLPQEIGLEALRKALQTDHFSSQFGFDFGSRKRNYGWAPKSEEEVHRWYAGFVNAALDFALRGGEMGKETRRVLGEAFHGLCRDAGMLDLLEEISHKLVVGDGWPEGWIGVRKTLHFDKKIIPAPRLAQLQALEQALAPRNLLEKIRGEVFCKGNFALDFVDDGEDNSRGIGAYERTHERAEELGVLTAGSPEVMSAILREILDADSNQKVFRFCVGCGAAVQSPLELLGTLRQMLAEREVSKRNFLPIRGILSGWNKTDPHSVEKFLDHALSDDVWGARLPELQCAVGLTDAGFRRILQSLNLGLAPSWQYTYLSFGRATDPLSPESIATLIARVSDLPEGPAVALDILGMVVHSAREKGDNFVSEIAEIAHNFMCTIDLDGLNTNEAMADHHLHEIISFVLLKTDEERQDTPLLSKILKWERSKKRSYSYGRGAYLKPFLQLRPQQTLDAVYIPDEDGSYRTARTLVANRDNERGKRPMAALPVGAALEWCSLSPIDRCLFLVETCNLYAQEEAVPDGDSEYRLSEIATKIFSAAPNKEEVLRALTHRLWPMSWSGSRAQKFKKRLNVLDDLERDTSEDVCQLISKERDRLFSVVADMEREEAEEERTRNASFE